MNELELSLLPTLGPTRKVKRIRTKSRNVTFMERCRLLSLFLKYEQARKTKENK